MLSPVILSLSQLYAALLPANHNPISGVLLGRLLFSRARSPGRCFAVSSRGTCYKPNEVAGFYVCRHTTPSSGSSWGGAESNEALLSVILNLKGDPLCSIPFI
jgi:hypothetical protein